MQKSSKAKYLAQAAVIAALYAALTYVANFFNLAYGAVQFRFSEALTILPLFTPAAIPGLTLGCFLSNLTSPFGIADWIFGSLATLLGALATRMISKIRVKDFPLFSPLMPVVFNALIIGLEVACFSNIGLFAFAHFSWVAFTSAAVSVGIGEFVVCYLLGVPFYFALQKTQKRYPSLI